jgi:hypothetical protein
MKSLRILVVLLFAIAGPTACTELSTGTEGQHVEQVSTVPDGPNTAMTASLPAGIAAVWHEQVVTLRRTRSDFGWPGQQSWSRVATLPGTARSLDFSKKTLGCTGLVLPTASTRLQMVVENRKASTGGASVIDTLELTEIPINCRGARHGATASMLVVEIRNRPIRYARAVYCQRPGEKIRERQPDGSESQSRFGDAILEGSVRVVGDLNPNLARSADAALKCGTTGTILRAFLHDGDARNLAKVFSPWVYLGALQQLEHEMVGTYYANVPAVEFKPVPKEKFYQKLLGELLDALEKTVQKLLEKLPEIVVSYLSKQFGV